MTRHLSIQFKDLLHPIPIAISVVILLAGAVGVAVFTIRAHHADATAAMAERNRQRLATIGEWQKLLLEESKKGALRDTLEKGDGPRQPAEGESYQYAKSAQSFVVCADFEGKEDIASFATNAGTFTAGRVSCGSEVSTAVANVVAVSGLDRQHATDVLNSADKFHFTTKEVVQDKCKSSQEVTNVYYGCALPGTEFYVIKFTDPEFVQETNVVAIHEYLHSVYDVQLKDDQAAIDRVLETELKRPDLGNFPREFEPYSAEQKHSEMFVRFATEVENLSPEAEAIYGRYFVNRQKIVAQHQPYKVVNDRIFSLYGEITRLKAQADARKSAGDIDGYNALVDPINSRIDEYNQLAGKHGLLKK